MIAAALVALVGLPLRSITPLGLAALVVLGGPIAFAWAMATASAAVSSS